MQKHKLKLLALLFIFAVAPASGHRIAATAAAHDPAACPEEHGRSGPDRGGAGEKVVTLTEQLRPAPLAGGGSWISP